MLVYIKRISIIVACILISIFSFSFQISKNNKTVENNNTMQATATPVSGKTIIIDAGHGSPDERSRKQ